MRQIAPQERGLAVEITRARVLASLARARTRRGGNKFRDFTSRYSATIGLMRGRNSVALKLHDDG